MWETKVKSSAGQFDDEQFLFCGFDRVGTVVGPDPAHRLAARMTGQDCKAGQGRSGAPVSSEATELHPFSSTSPLEHKSQGRDDLGRIIGDTEVRPVEVIMRPRRLPLVIKIEPVVRWVFTDVGVRGIERYGGDLGTIGQYDRRTVEVHFKSLVRVVRDTALGHFNVQVPVHLTFGTDHNRARVDHFLILAARGICTDASIQGTRAEGVRASRSVTRVVEYSTHG